MSQQTLQTPKPPVCMLTGHTTQQETSLTVHCYDKTFKQVTASLDTGAASDEPLFDVQGAVWGTSWSLRRKVHSRSSPGNAGSESTHSHLFDFRHHSLDLKNGWVVEAAGDGRVLATLVHSNFATKHHSNINATVYTTAGEDILVTMHQLGDDAKVVQLRVGGKPFATIEKAEANKTQVTLVGGFVMQQQAGGNKPRTVWKVKTAAGVDLSLVMVMVLSRAEMAHVWGK